MKEDIKRCEELIKEEHANWIGISNQKAIENLIKEYRDGEDILKNITKENLELKEYIRELEYENKVMKDRQGIGKITELSGENLDKVLSKWYIPKSKVKEKIEQLDYRCNSNLERAYKKEILQEIMESK